MPPTIRLVTGADLPDGDGEARFLASLLREAGWLVDVAAWSDVDKRQLLALAAQGVPVVPSRFTTEVLEGLRARDGWTDLGVKPAVGVDGVHVRRITRDASPGGEFRVQERWGGATVVAESEPAADALAGRALGAATGGAPPPLYGRVHLLRVDDDWRVTEVGVVEPSLYLQDDPARAARVEAALRRRWGP